MFLIFFFFLFFVSAATNYLPQGFCDYIPATANEVDTLCPKKVSDLTKMFTGVSGNLLALKQKSQINWDYKPVGNISKFGGKLQDTVTASKRNKNKQPFHTLKKYIIHELMEWKKDDLHKQATEQMNHFGRAMNQQLLDLTYGQKQSLEGLATLIATGFAVFHLERHNQANRFEARDDFEALAQNFVYQRLEQEYSQVLQLVKVRYTSKQNSYNMITTFEFKIKNLFLFLLCLCSTTNFFF